jgi:SAM-dependent methyltransferase
MKELWDKRYNTEQFVYGSTPNSFLKSELDKLEAGKLLLPGEGEGRNAVYAASKGWSVEAFDQSQVAKEKALAFAAKKEVRVDYQVSSLEDYAFKPKHFDAVGLVYFHAGTSGRILLHKHACKALKPGGILILEAFHTSQLGNSTGGPPSLEMLFNEETLLSDFASLEVLEISQAQVELDEGPFHQGEAEVIRFVGRKNQ